MLVPIFRRRVSFNCSKMIAHCHNPLLSPAVPRKPTSSQGPFLLFSPDFPQKPCSERIPFMVFLRNRLFQNCEPFHVAKVSTVDSTQSPNFASKVSRLARIEAQGVLLDYLHATRGYGFTDAEYISKHSPNFLRSLLSEIDDHKDVARSLRKLFSLLTFGDWNQESWPVSTMRTKKWLSACCTRFLLFLGKSVEI